MNTGVKGMSGEGKGIVRGTDVQAIGSVQEAAVTWGGWHVWLDRKAKYGGHDEPLSPWMFL